MTPETKNTFKVAVTLCLVCSVVVSALAVGLKDIQQAKKNAFRQQSILEAAGLWEEGADAAALYTDRIKPVVVDLQTNKPTTRYKADDKKLDLASILRDEQMYDKLDTAADIAGLKKREAYSVVYEVRDSKTNALQTMVLPIRGRGLWSTLYGFIAIDMTDLNQAPEGLDVAGLTYYKHGETPGLGGEVENKLWKAKWPSKRIFDDQWDVKIEVSKSASTDFQVDALSGATLTSNGVTNMLRFWLGDEGFGPYLQSLTGSPASVEQGNSADPIQNEEAAPEPAAAANSTTTTG